MAPPAMTAMAPPPPAFDQIAPQVFQQNAAAPSAPFAMAPPAPAISSADVDLLGGDFGGIMPVAPPSVSAPSFDQVMQQNLLAEHDGADANAEIHDFELEENGLNMSPEEKQKMIEEQRAIMEHIEKQKRDNKASEAAVKAEAFAARMSGEGGGMIMQSQSNVESVDGFSASEIEEQRRILAEIEAAKRSSFSAAAVSSSGVGIDQMEEDRKLAEALQAEENATAGEASGEVSGGYPGTRSAASAQASSGKSWWDTMNDAMVSVGMTAPAEDPPAHMNVSRPPGSQRTLHSAVTGDEGSERIGLLGADGGRPAARVAESKPIFSCLVDSVSNTAAAAGTYMMGEDDEEEVHGVDTSSFLAVPNAGRDKNEGGGSYFAIPPSN